MKHRKFVVASTVLMLAAAAIVAGLAMYSNFAVRAAIEDLPEVVRYLPADSQAVFGMNVKKFVASPVYAGFEQKHGDQIGRDLADFIAKTGVDPRKDVAYVVAAGKAVGEGTRKGAGVVIALGSFNSAGITTFIKRKHNPVEVNYKGATVLMIPEKDGTRIEKGIAFLKESEIALGDLESLKSALDARDNPNALGIRGNATLAPLIDKLNPAEMFWFAGDAASILAKAPTNTPFAENLSAVQSVVGTLNLSEAVTGDITATARDVDSATKLVQVVQGFLALGQLMSGKNPDLAEVLKGVSVTQKDNELRLLVNFPIELLNRLPHAKHL